MGSHFSIFDLVTMNTVVVRIVKKNYGKAGPLIMVVYLIHCAEEID